MTHHTPAVVAYADVTEAALSLGHRSYSGTVASTGRQASPVESFASVSAAALSLGHRSYSGTVASTERMP
ncbi:MAG TPA: hypothetical protein VEO01_24180 [Pseudonocardiaceae bacterium]|nr:hypothetical protein [Pseudonocardiaceae bacterium]